MGKIIVAAYITLDNVSLVVSREKILLINRVDPDSLSGHDHGFF